MKFERTTFIMAERLKALREGRGLSHQRLSRALREKYDINISKDALIAYESPEHHSRAGANNGMRVQYLRCLADFYGVSADYLLGLVKDPSPDMSVRAASELTGLSVHAIHELMEYTAPESDSKGISGFTATDLYRPQNFIDDLLTSPYLFRSALDFCNAINNYINNSAPNLTRKKYGVVDCDGDVVISAREFALLSVERSKSVFSEFISDLWAKLCDDYGVFVYEPYDYTEYADLIMQSVTDVNEEATHGET